MMLLTAGNTGVLSGQKTREVEQTGGFVRICEDLQRFEPFANCNKHLFCPIIRAVEADLPVFYAVRIHSRFDGLGLMVRGWWWQGVRASSTDGWEG